MNGFTPIAIHPAETDDGLQLRRITSILEDALSPFRVVRIGGSDIAVPEHSWSSRVGALNFPHIFVSADGALAEMLCNVELLGPLSVGRARQLIDIHGDHTDDCLVAHAARALDDEDDETSIVTQAGRRNDDQGCTRS